MIKIELLPPFHRQAAISRARNEALLIEAGRVPQHKYYVDGPDAYHIYAKDQMRLHDSMPKAFRELVYELGSSKTVYDLYHKGNTPTQVRNYILARRAARDKRFADLDRAQALASIELEL